MNSIILRLTEHEQTHSNIDQVILIAVLENGRRIALPLVYANHSSLGNVWTHLKFSDDRKTSIIGAYLNNGISESINLKFSARLIRRFQNIVKFVFIIEGNNPIIK